VLSWTTWWLIIFNSTINQEFLHNIIKNSFSRKIEKQAWNLEALVKERLHLISQFVWFLIKQACQVMWNWMSMDCVYLTTYGKNFKLNTVHSCTIHIWVWWPALNAGWGLHFTQPSIPPPEGWYHMTCLVLGGIALHVNFFTLHGMSHPPFKAVPHSCHLSCSLIL
jgi:hypothetical protein